MFVQNEVHDAGEAKRKNVADKDIPSSGEALDKQQRAHLEQKRAGAREIIARIMAEERTKRVRRDAVAPDGIVRQHKIGQYGAFERDKGRKQIFAPIMAFEQIVRAEPQDQHVHRRSRQRRERKTKIPDYYLFESISAHSPDV